MEEDVKSEWQLIKVLSSLVLILALIIIFDIMRPLSQGSSENLQALPSAQSVKRGIASGLPLLSDDKEIKKNQETLELSCLQEIQNFRLKSNTKRVQLKGSFCKEAVSAKEVIVKNLNNGFSGTVFIVNPDLWITDFVDLSPGSNSLQVTFITQTGNKKLAQVNLDRID